MWRLKLVGGFVGIFLLLYSAVLVPWPGWSETYARYLRLVASLALVGGNHEGLVRFQPAAVPARSGIDSAIVFSLPATTPRILAYDSRAVGWIPTGLTAALILSTPLPWRRRLRALVLGQLLIHFYVLFVLSVYLWNESQGRWPFVYGSFSPIVGAGLQQTFVTQMGLTFVIPVLIWLSVVISTDAGNVASNSQ